MIQVKDKLVIAASYGKRNIFRIYKGVKLVYEMIVGCFAKGYWINNKSWTNDKGWKN